ncbi:hypothetical protein CW304_25100 [Bacillus sp. UFRGS-B20]|nr:hypothetical protein CW304_25100 [Bacillus sp. UFRGS-B20]
MDFSTFYFKVYTFKISLPSIDTCQVFNRYVTSHLNTSINPNIYILNNFLKRSYPFYSILIYYQIK